MLNPLGWLRNRNPEKVQRNVMLDAFMRDVIVALTASCESTLGKDMWDTLPFFNVDYMNAEAVHEVIDDIGKNNPMLNVPAVEVDEIVEAIQATPGARLHYRKRREADAGNQGSIRHHDRTPPQRRAYPQGRRQ